MKPILSICLLGCTVSLSACGGGGSEGSVVEPLLGPDATLIEANSAYALLDVRVEDIFLAEGSTLYVDLPSGSPTFRGIISGGPDSTGGTGSMTYYGDLALTANLGDDTVSGSVKNVVTDVIDFENPTGTVTLSGFVLDGAGGAAEITFQGSGTLATGTVEALVTVLDADGVFVGDDGAGIQGTHLTNVDWTLGYIGAEESDGRFLAERN